MIEGKTNSGFEFHIDEDNLDDMEFIDALRELKEGDMTSLSNVADFILGAEQKKALYEHLKANDEKHKVRLKAFSEEVMFILTYNTNLKN